VRRGLVKSVATLLLGTVVLGLFGCGGGDSGSSLSKAEFIKQGNRVCEQANEERAEALEGKAKELKIESGEVATPAQQKQVVLAALATYEGATEKLKELVPSEQEGAVQPLIQTREELAKIVHASATSTPKPGPYKRANLLAIRYGLDECTV